MLCVVQCHLLWWECRNYKFVFFLDLLRRRDFSLSHLFAEAHDNIFGCGFVLVTFFVADHLRSAPEFTFF